MNTSVSASSYMLLFSGPEWDQGLPPEELERVMSHVMAWFEGLKLQGRIIAAEALCPESRRVSRNLARTVADGPFAESKEIVGGFLVLQADSFDEAVAIANSCPTLDYGISIEVRPVADECPTFKRVRQRLAAAIA